MKKQKKSTFYPFLIIGIILVIIVIIGIGLFYQSLKPAIGPVAGDIAQLVEQQETTQWPSVDEVNPVEPVNNTEFPLNLPQGTAISIFADDVDNARMMAFDSDGVLYLSQTRSNRVVALPDQNSDGKADEVIQILTNSDRPHGLAFTMIEKPVVSQTHHQNESGTFRIAVLPEPADMPELQITAEDATVTEVVEYLYVAETGRVIRMQKTGPMQFAEPEVIIDDLPAGGNHFTRSIAIAGEKLYVSTGSSCNVCEETQKHRATVWQYDLDGSNGVLYARGLRNAVGLEFHPRSGKLWATENGRDLLGDDLPPDEINIVEAGADYGWPYCYGDAIHDTNYDKRQYFQNPCADTVIPQVKLGAHVAPLGFAFYSGEEFPQLQDDLLVALHGSWNRSVPVGYKVIRVDIDGDEVVGVIDFIDGWLSQDNAAYGRPVDVITDREGRIYISDDKAGVVYRVSGALKK